MARLRLSEKVSAALLEAFFVVLGVALAYAANEWREERLAQDSAQIVLSTVLDELRANRDEVEVAVEYHSALLESLRELEARDAPSAPLSMFQEGFIRPARLLRTAWTAAHTTGTLHQLDYRVVLTLSEAYAAQDRYESQVEAMSGLIYSRLMNEGYSGILSHYRNLALPIQTFHYREEQLLFVYDDALDELRSD